MKNLLIAPVAALITLAGVGHASAQQDPYPPTTVAAQPPVTTVVVQLPPIPPPQIDPVAVPASLPKTGGDLRDSLMIGTTIVLGGAGLVLIARSRRRGTPSAA
jgi:LPXTG-motif cell wall-anchored protein